MISADNNKPSGKRSVALLCLAPGGDGSAYGGLRRMFVRAMVRRVVMGPLLDRVKRLCVPVLGVRGKHTAMLLCALWARLVGLGAAVVMVLPVMGGRW